jgi:hypothetical protein
LRKSRKTPDRITVSPIAAVFMQIIDLIDAADGLSFPTRIFAIKRQTPKAKTKGMPK